MLHDHPSPPSQPALLPADFSFSQSSLQAYADCPRRFWLTYVERLPWPAVEASPVQEHEFLMRLGDHFHRLVQRAEIGLDLRLVEAGLPAPLDAWFAAYQAYRPADLPGGRVEVERTLSVSLRLEPDVDGAAPPLRLAAKYDLIATGDDGRVVIVDWKTGRRRPSPTTLRQRLQSLVYPYVLVEAAPYLGWGPIAPEQVEMRYWFTAAPGQPIVFRYDRSQHAANTQLLQRLLRQILRGRNVDDFPLAPDTEVNRARLCRYCTYRSRCDRGIEAGQLDALDDLDDLIPDSTAARPDFGLDEIAELAF
jgi:hypothetical protein